MLTAVYKKGRKGYSAWIEEVPGVTQRSFSLAMKRNDLGIPPTRAK